MNRAERRRAARQPHSATVWTAHLHRDQTSAAFMNCLRALEWYDRRHEGHIDGYIDMTSGPLLSHARNQIVETFLDGPADWLWCLDDDMIFEPNALSRTMALADPDDAPIIGGLYFGGGRSAIVRPHVFTVFRADDGELATEARADFPRDLPFECDAVGAGALLVHRRVLEAVHAKWSPHTSQPWFQETEHAGRPFGEDVTFCLRARGCGFPLWVDPTIPYGHVKEYVINADVYDAQQARLKILSQDEVVRDHLRNRGVVL